MRETITMAIAVAFLLTTMWIGTNYRPDLQQEVGSVDICCQRPFEPSIGLIMAISFTSELLKEVHRR